MPRVEKEKYAHGLHLRDQAPMELLQQEPGERHGEHAERRHAEQQDTQLHADGLADAHECRHQDGQNQQVMHDGGGGPGGDPDPAGASAG